MKTLYRIKMLLLSFLLVCGFSACDNDDLSTQQYTGGVSLNVYGPQPVMRGGTLRFLGSNLDQVTQVIIPGVSPITEIDVRQAGIPSEIWVQVPVDGPEEGFVTLVTADGKEITTVTKLTYDEPIVFEGFSPATVKPGETLVITGDYLNLMHEVVFADDIAVPEENFVSHTRYRIEVIVPDAARTGEIVLSDAEEELPNWIYSEEELNVVLPAVASISDLTGKKPGDTVSLTGSDFDLIRQVLMPNGEAVDFDVQDNVLTFVLPENISDGAIVVIPASGVEVTVATVGVALPVVSKVTPQNGLRGGDVITIEGKNMELVKDVTFPGISDAVALASSSATEISVAMPELAVSGDLQLNTASGVSVPVAILTAKPADLSYASDALSLGSEVVINGSNLDLVVKVEFTGGAVAEPLSATADELKVQMPTSGAETGELTLHMANGETVTAPALTINAPEFCYIPELPSDEAGIKAGTVLNIGIANSDKLTGVQVDGQAVQYIVNGDLLYISIPQMAGQNSTVTLISSNGEVSYSIPFIPASEVEIVLMDQMVDLGSWDEPRVYIGADAFSQIPDNAINVKLRIVFAQKEEWGQVQINDGNWNNDGLVFPELVNEAAGNSGCYIKTDEIGGKDVTEIELSMDASIIARFRDNNGIVMQGQNWIISKVSIKYELSMDVIIWEGSWSCSNWSGNQDLAWGGYDWSSFRTGASLIFTIEYIDPTAGWACISPRVGDGWNAVPSIGQIDLVPAEGEHEVEYIPTQADVEAFRTQNGLVITGDGFILKKVTVR